MTESFIIAQQQTINISKNAQLERWSNWAFFDYRGLEAISQSKNHDSLKIKFHLSKATKMASAEINAKATHLIAKLTLSLVSLAFCKSRMVTMRLYVLYCQTYSGARIEAQSTIVFAVSAKASLRHQIGEMLGIYRAL